jgi:hypothetical protein
MRTGIAVAVLAVFALVGLGCEPTDIHRVKVPEGFDFSTTRDVTVKVTVVDVDGNAGSGTEITVGSTEQELVPGNILARGMTNGQGQFEGVVRIPARYAALRVYATIPGALNRGIPNRTDASILNNEVSVAFGPES